jgi:hypothetical protein
MRAMIARFDAQAAGLVERMLPRHARSVSRARTGFRPAAVAGRSQSPRHDDTRLHVDAFPTRPGRGERILRAFCNVNPQGADRVWRVGEPFEAMAARFLPRVRPMRRGEAALLSTLRVTKGRRSEYDHVMLALHDLAKLDEAYQVRCGAREVRFAPGTTWLCFSDQFMHAVVSGQYMMEQTLHVPLDAMRDRGGVAACGVGASVGPPNDLKACPRPPRSAPIWSKPHPYLRCDARSSNQPREETR